MPGRKVEQRGSGAPGGKFLPPVELYKLGGEYFVLDGNHRVSVARYRGIAAVDAMVTEFLAPCGC